jgi:hypothetical protein
VVALPSRAGSLDRTLDIDVPEGTDLAGALQLAGAIMPPDAAGRIVLFTDANATTGDPIEAAETVAGASGAADTSRQGVPIDVVPFSYDVAREVIVDAVDTPPRAQEESTITVRVTLLSTGESTGTLLLMRDGETIDIDPGPGRGRRLALAPGRHVELISVELEPGRLHPFLAVVEPDVQTGPDGQPTLVGDTLTENNRAEAFTITPGKGSVLILDPTAGGAGSTDSDALAGALRRSGIDVEVRPPAGAPTPSSPIRISTSSCSQTSPPTHSARARRARWRPTFAISAAASSCSAAQTPSAPAPGRAHPSSPSSPSASTFPRVS